MSGDMDLSRTALERIRAMQAKEARLESSARWDVHSLLLHAGMLIRSKQRVDGHLAALIAVPSASACDQVIVVLDQRRDARYQRTSLYRAAMFLVGLAVFAYALAAFRKTRRQAGELSCANETLEARVTARTRDLQNTNAELRQSEQRFRAIFDNASIGIARLSLEGCLLEANPALRAILGRAEAVLAGSAIAEFIETTWLEHFQERLAALQHATDIAAPGLSAYEEVKFAHSDGSERWGQVGMSSVCAEAGTPLFLILLVQDTTDQKAAEQRIERLAYHDGLTGLPNRTAFLERLKTAIGRAESQRQRMALLFIDCDNFKQINDTLGHDAGDEFLKQRAVCMRDSLRPDDTLARLGGDEFTILLENLPDEATAAHVARRILKNLNDPMRLMGQEIFGGASIGIAFNRGDEVTAESMLRNADTAMYQIKTASKGDCIVFEQDMNDRANEQMRVESGLRRALEKGELRVHYQPLIDLTTGRLTGSEALVRWEHPELGLIPPGKFIPVAEDTGLIIPLGNWVLEEACRQTKEWQTLWPQDPPLMVNVNLSGHQLKRADVVETIVNIVLKTGFPINCLRLEITESVMMSNLNEAKAKLNRLKALGIKIALDDFGTGYSSVASLVDLPVDSIKIDRSFVSRLGHQEQASATIGAIIALAKAHGLDVTGEGVETPEQVAHLQNYGCLLGQGYFFAKPLSASAFRSKLGEGDASFIGKISGMEKQHIEEMLNQFYSPPVEQTRLAA